MVLSLIEQLILNDENIERAKRSGLIETLQQTVMFWTQSLHNFHDEGRHHSSFSTPQLSHFKTLIRCLTSMMRSQQTVDKLVNTNNCRTLQSLVVLMKLLMEEEIVANSLKIIRNCLKLEDVHQQVVKALPNLINEIVMEAFQHFDHSSFINAEMRSILGLFCRRREFMFLMKPQTLDLLARHPSQILNDFPTL
jgi:hypothetical protein